MVVNLSMGAKWNQHKLIYCKLCKKPMKLIPSLLNKRKTCSRKCAGKIISQTRKGKNHPTFKERVKSTQGYWIIKDKNNKRILEHRLIMEMKIKRKLKRYEIVHHRNHNKLDNRIENLILITQSEHIKLHVNNLGNFHSQETKNKISHSKLGSIPWNKGMKFS